jgi:hypothetical protein
MALMGAATSERRGGSAAAVLDFAVAQILGDDTALGALPAVLARMVEAFGLRGALAFQPSGGQDPAVLAVHPAGAPAGLLGDADRYLEKPLRVDQLIATATALIGRGRPLSDDPRRDNLRTWP